MGSPSRRVPRGLSSARESPPEDSYQGSFRNTGPGDRTGQRRPYIRANVARSAGVVLVVVALVGCGASHPARTSTEVLELRQSGLGRAYVKVQGSIPVVRLAGHMMVRRLRGGGFRLTPAPAVHGHRRCSVVFVVGNEAPSGLSGYAGERTKISVFGNAELSHAFCSAWKSG
jgi:hypothetical protein